MDRAIDIIDEAVRKVERERKYKFLTAKQLGNLSQRSRQFIRRKQRDLASETTSQ